MAPTYTADEDGSDDDYGKPSRKPNSRDKRLPPHTEIGRATRHTLDENLEQMMSSSFNMSFLSGADDGEQQRFSPRIGAGFDFGDSEDFGFGDIGDELAKELGEGWASAPLQPKLVLSPWLRWNVHVIIAGPPQGQNSNFPSTLTKVT